MIDSNTEKAAELEELILHCACGTRATHAIDLHLLVDGQVAHAQLPVCEQHTDARIVGREIMIVLTHQDFHAVRAEKFPPRKGEVLAKPLAVGCPKCGQYSTLDTHVFGLNEQGVTPSFICPYEGCGVHVWMRLPTDAASIDDDGLLEELAEEVRKGGDW